MAKRKYPRLAVDVVIYDENRGILLVRRKSPPFKGYWALPGGMVEYGETVEEAALREVKEETNLDVDLIDLVGVYSDPNRDPRWHTVSIAFLARVKQGYAKAGSDAELTKWFRELPNVLAFDHQKIINDALKKLRVDICYE
ncbi:MAG: NUDIX domain-containing protein [Candidatus Asgardarchaeia archaeon]